MEEIKVVRSAIDVRKAIFNFIIESEDFMIEDLFKHASIVEKEKIFVYNYLKELCYFNYIQGIRQNNTTRYLKVKL